MQLNFIWSINLRFPSWNLQVHVPVCLDSFAARLSSSSVVSAEADGPPGSKQTLSQSRRALEPSSTSSRGFISVSLRSFGLQQQEIKGAWRHARLPPLLDLCEPLSLMKIAAHSDKGPRICWLYNNAGAVNRPWGECVCVCGGCGLHVIHEVDNQFYDCLGVIHTASASWFRFSWLNFFSFSFFVLWTFCIDLFFFFPSV